jgi:signal transduction histidine kinase
MIHLTIRDDGHGIPEDALKGGGIGLLSIREYTRSIGGVSRITSSGSKGTTIQISLPLTEE